MRLIGMRSKALIPLIFSVITSVVLGCAGVRFTEPMTYQVRLDDQIFTVNIPESHDQSSVTHLPAVSLHDDTLFDRDGLVRVLGFSWAYGEGFIFRRVGGELVFKVILARASGNDVRDKGVLKREILASYDRSFADLGLPLRSGIEEVQINGRTWLKYHHVVTGTEYATALSAKRYLKARFRYVDNGSDRWHSKADRVVDDIRASMQLRSFGVTSSSN